METLSDKMWIMMPPTFDEEGNHNGLFNKVDMIYGCDVKEFIKDLKKKFEDDRAWEIRLEIIDKLAGEKLI